MPNVADVLAVLERLVPSGKAASWDPIGLQVGDDDAEVRRVAVCHEVTDEVVAAVAAGDLLVAYHPLLFRPVGRFVAGGGPVGRAFALARAGVALHVVHTAFDVAPGGAADALAAALGLTEVEGFGPLWPSDQAKVVTFAPPTSVDRVAGAMASAGAGRIGRYTACSFRAEGVGTFLPGPGAAPFSGLVGELNREPEVRLEMVSPVGRVDAVVAALVATHPYEEPAFDVIETRANAGLVGRIGTLPAPVDLAGLAASVGEVLDGAVRHCGLADRPVRRVAVVPGSGSALLHDVPPDADVLVTGDVSHHRAREALDRGLAVVDAGHAPTERPGVDALYAALRDELPVPVARMPMDPDPWRTPPWRS